MGSLPLLALLALSSPASAQGDEEQASADIVEEVQESVMIVAVQQQAADVKVASLELNTLLAFTRDADLAKKGFAPEGWVHPPYEVYEIDLGLRPSLLPYDNFMQAVSTGHCSVDDGDRYTSWMLEQEEAQAAAAAP